MDRAEVYAAAKQSGALIDLSARAKWRVTGADRVRFLNGQVSNDVRKIGPHKAVPACVMTAKGKMSGDVFVAAENDFLNVDAEAVLRESLAARLERYIISDDVTIEDWTEQSCLFHVLAGAAPLELADFTKVPARQANRFGRTGFDLLAPQEKHDEIWAELAGDLIALDAELVETLRIEAGVPRWAAELTEETIPVEAALDKTAIDYHKGCYIGQEVISRLKSLGHVNRALHGFVSASPLSAGLELFAEDAGKPCGRLTSAAWSFGLEKFAALGYLKRGVTAPVLQARDAHGTVCAVEVRELPLIS